MPGEIYIASIDQWSHENGRTGTSPHVDLNYGLFTNIQFHFLASVA